VSGQIRVVEVEMFDYSACGGTHCPWTGMIGLIKILKTERKNKKLRLHFAAGTQALTYFQQYHQVLTDLGRHLSAGPGDLVGIVQQQASQLQTAQKELQTLQAELLAIEAQKLAGQAEPIAGGRLVTRLYQNRPAGDLRELAKLLQTEAELVALLAGYDGQKLALVVSCGPETACNAGELLAKHLAQIDGRGGGGPHLAQGGGEATPAQVEHFFANTLAYL
jgi:alanyl-tRNA synthetase